MDRASLVELRDIDENNIATVLQKAEAFKLRFPETFDGWYITGLCHYKLGNRGEALYNLSMAYLISSDERAKKYIELLGGSIDRQHIYEMVHSAKENMGSVVTIAIILGFAVFLFIRLAGLS
jgi:hypothetical protein